MKTRMSYDQAKVIADRIVEQLAPACERIEIAGSIRRQKETIGDIEIVCIPKHGEQSNLFGEKAEYSLLDDQLNNLCKQGVFRSIKGGELYKQYRVAYYYYGEGSDEFILGSDCPMNCQRYIALDLFITTPRKWGVIFVIRTGSAEFSHWLMTSRSYGGAKPSYIKAYDGVLWAGDKVIPTPEEIDVFKALGLDWIEPKDRER